MFGPKVLAKLQQKKYRLEYGCFIVEGKKGVLEALESSSEVLQLVLTDAFLHQQPDFVTHPRVHAFLHSHAVLELPTGEFDRLMDSATPQGVAAVVRLPDTPLSALLAGSLIGVMEDIRDPGNLGTMIRTADWFGVDGLLLLGGADPYQPKVVRSTMGSLFHVPIVSSNTGLEALQELKQAGFQVVVTRPETSSTVGSSELAKTCVVFGNESTGTSAAIDALADRTLSVPRFGAAESLNVAVSFGIVMHELRRTERSGALLQ